VMVVVVVLVVVERVDTVGSSLKVDGGCHRGW
jgi:hypothetical protein